MQAQVGSPASIGRPLRRAMTWGRLGMAPLALVLGVAACAPSNTNTTFQGNQIGRASSVSKGVILSMREVQVKGSDGTLGTVIGGGAGAVAGSAIGGGTRANILGGIAGAVLGGLAGSAVDRGVSSGTAVEFIIREENAPNPIAVVQTNEEGLKPGEAVLILRSDRIRLARDVGQTAG